MSIELARRLLGSGAPVTCVETALSAEVDGNEPFVTALLDRYPELTSLVERELERTGTPEIHVVRASTDLSMRLPSGMCERLLAVPVFRDPESGRVDVAAVDVLNGHVAVEFGFQLDTKVRVLRASLPAVRGALSGLEAGRGAAASVRGKDPSRRPSGAALPRVDASGGPRPSEPPIPLVRPSPTGRPATPAPKPVEEVALNLTRAKVGALAPFAFTSSLESAVSDVASARTPDELAASVASAMDPALALVLAVRSGSFDARASSTALGAEPPTFSVAADKSSVFDIAVRSGHYLGTLPGTLVHAELRALIGAGASEEVYVAPVLVGGRAALVVLIARMGPAFEATRRADELIRVASDVLSRIVRARKQR